MRSVLILIPYFGKWPEWIELYLHTCKNNPSIDWIFFTDCEVPNDSPKNVRFIRYSFSDYCRLISERLRISFQPETPYKLCDIRPALGFIHYDLVKDYDNFSYGDVDLFYGDLRKHYPDKLLRKLLVSTHKNYVSGHLCMIRNNFTGRNLFRLIPRWKERFQNPNHLALDDRQFTILFIGWKPYDRLRSRIYRLLNPLFWISSLEERFTTPLSPIPWTDGSMRHPETWFYKDGKITNDIDGTRCFPYLHFMNYKNSRYLCPEFGAKAPWENLTTIFSQKLPSLDSGWKITKKGIESL